MLVGEQQADESNRRRSTTLRTTYVFVLAGNALISDRRVIAICWKYGLRRYAAWRLIGISDGSAFDIQTGKCSPGRWLEEIWLATYRSIPITPVWIDEELPARALMRERETIHLIVTISKRQKPETLLWRMSLT
jgi:hypothetical protein